MGVFKFLSDAGAKLLGKDADATGADNIKKKIETDLPGGIKNLKVEFKGGVVSLSGECQDTPVKEKAVLIAGNIQGVKEVHDDNIKVVNPTPPVQLYTIVSGDTLGKIAKKYYGDAMKYPVIFEANREVIKNADLIYPGQVIRIPKL